MTTAASARSRRPRRVLAAAALAAVALAAVAAVALDRAARIEPPPVEPPAAENVHHQGASARVGPAYLVRRGALRVLHVQGGPGALGYRHARLTSELMTEGDRRMLELFREMVPSSPLRWALTELVRFRYRHLDDGFPAPRRAEIFGEARGYDDRFSDFLPTYARLVYLHGLYDIALAFERSPLLGCTAFAASGPATADGSTPGHLIVGRNFDLNIDPWFDEEKLVEIVEPEGGLAFASVAWPGMTGVVTGLNEAGIWVSVNGGRASEPRTGGVPVVFTTRAVLERARSLDEALAVVAADEPMVSHILLLADGESGESAVVERAPGLPLGVVRHASATVLANHYRTAPYRDDPKDARIRDITSTQARQARMEELVAERRGSIDPAVAVAMLRDRRGAGGVPLALGHGAAIDALIATHSVVADATARVLWVSEGPHTLGAYREIDLRARLERGEAAAAVEAPGDLPADGLRESPDWARYRRGERLRLAAEAEAAAGRHEAAAELERRAIEVRADDAEAWRGLALAAGELGRAEAARRAWARVLELAPESPEARREAEAGARGE